jgi:hypothetical protein
VAAVQRGSVVTTRPKHRFEESLISQAILPNSACPLDEAEIGSFGHTDTIARARRRGTGRWGLAAHRKMHARRDLATRLQATSLFREERQHKRLSGGPPRSRMAIPNRVAHLRGIARAAGTRVKLLLCWRALARVAACWGPRDSIDLLALASIDIDMP